MPVTEQTPYIEYTANGSTTSFALPFYCDNADYLVVKIDDVEAVGTWTLQGASVVFITAPIANSIVSIERNTPLERTTDYQTYDDSFRPKSVNKDFDRVWWKLQELGYIDGLLLQKIVKEIQDRIAGDASLQLQVSQEIINRINGDKVTLEDAKEYIRKLLALIVSNGIITRWTDDLVYTWSSRTQQDKNKEIKSVLDFSSDFTSFFADNAGIKLIPAGDYDLSEIPSFATNDVIMLADPNVRFTNKQMQLGSTTFPTGGSGFTGENQPLWAQFLLSKTYKQSDNWQGYGNIFNIASVAVSETPSYSQGGAQVVAGYGQGIAKVEKSAAYAANFSAYSFVESGTPVGIEVNAVYKGVTSTQTSRGVGIQIITAGSSNLRSALYIGSNSASAKWGQGIEIACSSTSNYVNSMIMLGNTYDIETPRFLRSVAKATIAEIDFPSFKVGVTPTNPSEGIAKINILGAASGGAPRIMSLDPNNTSCHLQLEPQGSGGNTYIGGITIASTKTDGTPTLGSTGRMFGKSFVATRHFTATIFDSVGAGSPEGVVTAAQGSTYRRTDGGAGTSLYVKETGTGNTGWAAK